jgi:hypothetical protein
MARRGGLRTELRWGQAGGGRELTGVVGEWARQAEPEELAKGAAFKDRVGTAVEVTNSAEAFYRQGQAGQKPDHYQAAALMVADVLKAVAVFGPSADGLNP